MENNTPQIIADTYKIIGRIGSGGGGVVYLAEHLRLDKKVVLKADKRALSTKADVLRREVDSLKNLNHTYIPQVYDFIEDAGTVYTVMDYIDGDSFDKLIKRGERFTQAQIIEWACQLLEALTYLHGRPPHGILHADIKPSNVMLTPQCDIRLIDYNIALALGEEGAIAVGRSFGYASPEHYGLDYSSSGTKRDTTTDVATIISDNTASSVETVLETEPERSTSGSTTSKKTIMLNVRSDIYSLGATLYNIMTGERPSKNATDIKPISTNDYSPAFAAIITKAMNPSQDFRWQSAEEMLHAIEHLRENDLRSRRLKRTIFAATSLMILLFLLGGFITFVGLKQMEQLQNAYVLAEYSGNALRSGDTASAINYALQALPEKRDIFTPPNTAEAQKALTDALNVYDLSDGFKALRSVELPSAPLFLRISPDGKTAACVYSNAVAVFDTETAEILATLPTERSALSEVRYVGDDTIIYAGDDGIKAYSILNGIELWEGEPATFIAVSADGKTAVAVYKDETFATVYSIESGQVIRKVGFDNKHLRVTVNDSFANPNDNLLALNHDGSLLGVSFADGSLLVYDLDNSDEDLEIFDNTSGFTHFEGGFYQQYLAFSATNSEGSMFVVIDTEELVQTGGFEASSPFGVQADERGIYVQTENVLVKIHPVTGEQTALVETYETIDRFALSSNHTLITVDNEFMFFDKNASLITRHEKEKTSDFIQIAGDKALVGSLDSPSIRIMRLESHDDAEIFAYDPSNIYDEARLSADGRTVMLFSYDRIRLYSIGGDVIADIPIPDAEQLYDQQYRRDEKGSRLEVIYNDGTIRAYSAADGSVMYETSGERPDLTLYEEFFTDTLRIESPLHGVPAAYDVKTGKHVKDLEKDAYLTYVTQVGDYIITEYVTAEGVRYGLLLNQRCETLAYLPNLCDIVGTELIFNYSTGNLRKTRIYHIDELIGLAREQITK